MKRIIFSLAALTFIAAAIALLNGSILPRKPDEVSRCPREALTRSDTKSDRIHPEKVVVRPWKGRHQVYAIFVLPDDYEIDNAVVVNIEGEMTYCASKPAKVKGDEFQGVYAKPGEDIFVARFRTRTASWLIAQGKVEALKQPHNWSLRR
ncbi:MAG: hypothetical protein N4J56_004847 [Chroococcidiopsis sp. SAG 2025]|uniref:hypothetical protein n=1 Tax=Chroococcidiopsis sp. SAG 2025 TaxID=171389 RepID=UPI0029373FBC|nr:hypothetical protein [Chroococcidiopsis sp. SAG 2025]MDV2995193.1 hypothetical protein [Chroococcidiopsis sp. SAG 2025]